MKTEGIYSVKAVEIPAKYGEQITVYVIGDVHYGSPSHAREKWEYDRDRITGEQKKGPVYFILDGDILEAYSSSERRNYIVSNPHESNKKRNAWNFADDVRKFVKENSFLLGKTLSVYNGNHYFEFPDGTNSDQMLARELGATYVGVCGYTILTLRIDKNHSHAVKIFVHHGKGSGRRSGSMFNALEDAASYFVDADIICMGHNHKMGCIPLPAIRCDMGKGGFYKTKEVHRLVGRSGSYLKIYEEGESSYGVDEMYSPSTLGCLPLRITPMRYEPVINGKRDERRWVELESVVRA